MRYTLSVLTLLFFSCYSLERDCLPFHQGEFKFTQIINGEMKSSYFTRNATYETIRWVNDCECILTKLNQTSNQDKRPIQIRILSTEDNRYTFEYSLVGDSKNKQRGTIEKIK
jgi:hypothetical protein